jgi:uncharacterized repeat protein (TIGR01451 family)
MTTRAPDRLYDLLPAVHRRRDTEQGDPLRALLQVIGEQVQVVEDDIERLYENWFIETCDDWVVPYLGDLIGYTSVATAGEPGDGTDPSRRALERVLVPRREVANTIRYRRRKGTLALLELLGNDVAGWPARAVEFYQQLAWAQPLNHQRLSRGRTASLRDGDALDLLGGPFDTLAHSVDVRRAGSARTRGRPNIPGVGLFVWRLRAYSVTKAPAYCYESYGSGSYTFSVLGNDAPLFTRPVAEPSPESIAGPTQVPAPIRRRALQRDVDAYYGEDRSFALWVDGWNGHTAKEPLPAKVLIVADLTDWKYRPPRGRVAIDPVLGRIAFPPRQLPRNGVWVSYHYGFSDDTGGGEYERVLSQPADAVVYRVGQDEAITRIGDALVKWRDEKPRHAVIEIADSGVYVEQVNVELAAGQSLQLRADTLRRPVLRLMDWQTARPDALAVTGEKGSRFTLDGLLVAGRSVRCEGPLAEVNLRHCTLVPGWTLAPNCDPRRPAEPSLELTDTRARVIIHRTILGSIQVSQDEVGADPITIRITDSILDATSPEREAIGAPTWPLAHAVLTIKRTTVFGEIQAHAIQLAENSIFAGRIRVARRQLGCMRFCYVTPGSRTPRRYRCQPDIAEEAVRAALPGTEVGPQAHARLEVGGEEAEDACAPAVGEANLEISVDVDDATPDIGDQVVVTVTLRNHGPRDAGGVRALLTGPDGLELVGLPVASQGTFVVGDDGLTWHAGDLPAGETAMLTLAVEIVAALAPPEIHASITAYTLSGDGQGFVAGRIARARARVRPRFNATRYGMPAYAQLAAACPPEIVRGADDESEMGAFHDLFQPQRTANLQARLAEFVPAGMDAAIILAS